MIPSDTPTVIRTPPMPSALTGASTDDDPRRRLVPVEDTDEVPRETLDILGQARDALFQLLGGIFQAAEAIVTALLRLVQSIAGREVAEAVDRGVADVLDPLVPDLPPSGESPGEETPAPIPTSETDDPAPPTPPVETRAATLRDEVRDVLLDHAGSEEERAAVSPAFVEMVTTGVQFALSVERQFPGAVDALQARTAAVGDDRTETETRPETVAGTRTDTPPSESVVAY